MLVYMGIKKTSEGSVNGREYSVIEKLNDMESFKYLKVLFKFMAKGESKNKNLIWIIIIVALIIFVIALGLTGKLPLAVVNP